MTGLVSEYSASVLPGTRAADPLLKPWNCGSTLEREYTVASCFLQVSRSRNYDLSHVAALPQQSRRAMQSLTLG